MFCTVFHQLRVGGLDVFGFPGTNQAVRKFDAALYRVTFASTSPAELIIIIIVYFNLNTLAKLDPRLVT